MWQAANLALAPSSGAIALVLGFGCGALLVYGGVCWVRSLGYTPWLGFLALLSYLGVGFLFMLPRRPRGKRLIGIFADHATSEIDAHA